jgi:putative nucleotidyltransferase with HDIG domain
MNNMSEDKQEQTGDVGKVLDRIQKLPSPPTLVMEILENFDNENVDITTLVNKIARDQAIVARVMRVANSPFFGLSGQIGSISEAISVLGINNLRGLVMTAGIINAFPRLETGFDWMAFWRHSIATAVCAKVLARHVGMNPETAFTAGLLHDIGKLVMGVYFPQAFIQLHEVNDGDSMESLQAERAALGFDHAALGGEVAKRWHFPLAIRQAVELHHTTIKVGEEKTLTDVIYMANLFSHALGDGRIREDRAAHLAAQAWARLGLDSDKLEALAGEAQRLYDGAVMLLGS